MMNQKEIEAAGREEYALWRKSQDRLNSIKAYMEKNATAHIDRLDKAISSGDPASMLDVFGPGGGMAGVTKKVGLALKSHSAVNAKGNVDKDWIKRKQDNVEMKTLKDGTEIPYYKTDQTGSLNKQVKVPVKVLNKLRGINDEQNNIRKESLDKIKTYMKKHGDAPSKKESIDIFVDQKGKGWILDGNHRIKAASDLGKDSLNVEVRYWNGGEYAKNSDFSLDNLIKYGN